MPIISTISNISSRGFGQLNGGRGLILSTYTFPPGTSTFTVPSVTTNLISVTGAGADGTPSTTNFNVLAARQVIVLNRNPNPINGGVSLTYDALISELNSVASTANLGGVTYYNLKGIQVGTNNLCRVVQDPVSVTTNAGTVTAIIAPSSTPTTGPVTHASLSLTTAQLYIQYRYDEVIPATTGAATTGFGLTFPGGAGGPSTTTTVNNVAVVPNQTYTIQNNKTLTITYFG